MGERYVIQDFMVHPFRQGQRVTLDELLEAKVDVDRMLLHGAIGVEYVDESPVEARPANPLAAPAEIVVIPRTFGDAEELEDDERAGETASFPIDQRPADLAQVSILQGMARVPHDLPPLVTAPAPLPPLVLSINSDPPPPAETPPASTGTTESVPPPAPEGPTEPKADPTVSDVAPAPSEAEPAAVSELPPLPPPADEPTAAPGRRGKKALTPSDGVPA